MRSSGWLAPAVMALCMAFEARPASAQTADLTELSLEDLLNTEITSVVTRASAVPGSNAAASRAFAVQASSAAYTNVDIRVAWAVRPPIELAFGVQKLMHDRTLEFVDTTGVQSSPTRTAAFGELAWRF